MFDTFDNSGFIRINFHSSDATALRITQQARRMNVPVVSSPSTMGGYTFPILEDIAEGRNFQILKCPLPGDDEKHQLELQAVLNDENTVYPYVDAGNITIVQIEGWTRGVDSLAAHGWSMVSSQKTFKRAKTLNRPFRTWAKLDAPIRVHIVEPDSYTDLDTDLYDDETLERLLDGAFVVAPWIRMACMGNVSFPTASTYNAQYSVDDFRRKMFVARARNVEAWNTRIFGPMIFTGIRPDDPLHERPGQLKGEAFVHTSDICELMKVDVIAARSALKTEVSCDRKVFILMEAQSPKFEGVMSDLQTMTNLPALYQPEWVQESTKAFLLKNFVDLTHNKLLDYWYEMTSPMYNRETAMYDMQDVATLTKWNARAWVMSGLPVTYSPWLFEQLAGSIISSLKPTDNSKMRFPALCAIRCQVISNSYAGMCGYDIEIEPGQARFINALESVVVHDEDWLEMYRSHGGHDLDDFFVCYYRTMGDVRKIVVVRSPNDFGEYSIFDYVEGDFAPSFTTNSGEELYFPEVSDAEEYWPMRLSEAYEAGLVRYRGLPSENEDKPASTGTWYCMEDVISAIENNRSSQACVGANVNARSLWTLTTRCYREDQLTTMEGCIDAGAQGGSAADTEAVMVEAKEIVKKVIEETNGPIDAYLWTTRFAAIHKYPFDMSRISTDGYITQNDEFRRHYAAHFLNMARDWAQQNCVNRLDPVIHTLGIVHARLAYTLLRTSRANLVSSQRTKAEMIDMDAWRLVHGPVHTALEAQPTVVDKHNLAIALLSACHKMPTATTGRYSDQLVMNPEIFPYVLDALRFYGLAGYLNINENGKIERSYVSKWRLTCSACDLSVETNNPVTLQSFHFYNGLCKSCRPEAG
jgi:hypothetical protein